ncbi:MAG: hypothetical protein J7539_10245 [Niabella sp.]|nr:hypothetical protein [Niabella sp.]
MNILRLACLDEDAEGLSFKTTQIFFFILILLSSSAAAQRDSVQYFSKDIYPMSSLCSKTLVLGANGVFFQERGCEGSSTVSFGKYTCAENGLTSFHFIPFDSVRMVKTVLFKPGSTDKTIDAIKLVTLEGDTLRSVLIDLSEFTDSVSNEMQRWFLKIGNRQDTIGVNYSKLKEFYDEVYSKELPGLYNGNTIVVQVNIPRIFFYYGQWSIELPDDFQLVRRPFGLYSEDGLHRVYTLNH